MKQIKCIVVLMGMLLCALTAFSQNRFKLSGELPAEYKGFEVQLRSCYDEFKPINKIASGSNFLLEGSLRDSYACVFLTVKKDGEHITGWRFFIQPGDMQVSISGGKENDIRFSDNVPFVEEKGAYDAFLKPVNDSVRYNFDLLRKVQSNLVRGYDKDSLTAVARHYQSERVHKKIQFIKSLRGNYLALYLFKEDLLHNVHAISISPDSMMNIFSSFSEPVKKSKLGEAVHSVISKKQSLYLHNTLPDFSFVTDAKEQYRLSAFRGEKHVLLCFWDAGCRPCIESFPMMKKIDSTYRSKGLQIVSVSLDDREAFWRLALDKYKLPWLQTCDIPSYVAGEKVQSLYAVTYIPQYFLIDKTGRAIYHNTHSGDDDDYKVLLQKLDEVLH
jgi:peroxiredoxin